MTVRVWPLICAWAEWRRRQRRGRRNVRMAELSVRTGTRVTVDSQ